MKPEELQIYDWVLINDTPHQVKQITQKKVGYHKVPYSLDYARLVEVKPIPITAEILEKNGINNELWLGSTYIWKKEDLFISYILRYRVLTVRGRKGESRSAVGYIHQLQQALRLCGIDKKIEL